MRKSKNTSTLVNRWSFKKKPGNGGNPAKLAKNPTLNQLVSDWLVLFEAKCRIDPKHNVLKATKLAQVVIA